MRRSIDISRNTPILRVFFIIAALTISLHGISLYSQNYPQRGSSLPETQRIDVTPKGEGRYLWVPDSLQQEVENILAGKREKSYVATVAPDTVVKEISAAIDERNEKVVFRGDTIPMVLKQRNFGRFDRGMLNYLFMPKGYWAFGLTASYGDFSTDNMEMMSLIKDVGVNAYMYSVKPTVAYYINNNMSVGLRFAYTAAHAGIDSFKVDIDEDMNFNLHDIDYKDESYSAAIVFTQYVGLARRGRFAVFNEVELAFSSGSTDFTRPFKEAPKFTHSTYMKAALNFSPGVSVKVMQNVAFNVSFGVFGFQLRNEKQFVDGEPGGNRFTSGANFKFNIFNINFGLQVHI